MSTIQPVVKFNAGEPIGSFCSRLAAAYGVRSASYFAELFEFSFRGLMNGEHRDVQVFAEITGISPARLFDGLATQVGCNVVVNGHLFARRFVDPLRCRLCPQCVIEGVGQQGNFTRTFAKVQWMLKSMRCCPVHDCQLMTFRGRTWQDSADFFWVVRENFKLIERSTAQLASSPFEHYLSSRIMQSAGGYTWLDGLPLQAAIHFTETLGAVIRHGTEPDLETLTASGWVDAGREGIAVTGSGLPAVKQVLREIASRSMPRGKKSLPMVFGRLAAEVLEFENDPGYRDIISIMKEVVGV
ncbi:TniQ family protein (plasmid) [Rhizobium sp. CB3171]|uniref:TniQ family protein n=1 Tax=Rhizobium sp. CB3171 TaxID=3039157 RepID=UPI0024B1CB9A|nr:TniQ family protein [Rhizobium sp. CB3171]WFU06323.1 TniQ family protein [Rhizobium sp. CB3171]